MGLKENVEFNLEDECSRSSLVVLAVNLTETERPKIDFHLYLVWCSGECRVGSKQPSRFDSRRCSGLTAAEDVAGRGRVYKYSRREIAHKSTRCAGPPRIQPGLPYTVMP
ncbi:unnamed protein product [Pieris brassicae]|uniref:Uncharacterized protein n=1 Tax=Pieris brassicae TaxID=7116 RepID=A0A9P0X7S7_PIEBR|nr:unnamed protein product [Pieris brassicae]